MRTKQETDAFFEKSLLQKAAAFLNGQWSSLVVWFSAVPDRFLDTEGNHSMPRVLVTCSLLSL